jgi:prepilin-type N-terminal cleavage/methylation domain-containing protein
MKNSRGFTLIEMMIAMVIILIVSLGFFGWASVVANTNISAKKNNTAYAMAKDIGESLQRMDGNNQLISPKTGNGKRIAYNSAGDMRKCSGSTISIHPVDSSNGTTEYTKPWDAASSLLYLYDLNNCDGLTWSNANCGGTGKVAINAAANSKVDHPNQAATMYDVINPVRSYHNTTFYGVWSIAFVPCSSINTDKRKIFVTVYWIDPEPQDTTVAAVQGKIADGTYTMKQVSLVMDKSVGTE